MFVTDRVLDIILRAKNDAYSLAISASDIGHSLSVGSLQNEIVGLNKTVVKLEEQLKYERARADGLVDRLLVRDARVAAVAPSAVAAAVHKDAESVKKLTEIFDAINDVGVEHPGEQRAFDMAGGTAVSPGSRSGRL